MWDIGTRSPATLVRDIGAALGSGRTLARSMLRFAVGLAALALGAAALVSALLQPRDITIIETWALIAGLVVEQLVGPDLRARSARRRTTR